MGSVHAANLARNCPSAELTSVFDPLAERAREVAEACGVRAVATFADLVGDESLDGVVIASPTGQHAELCLRAARAGKQIFCEKPISLDRRATLEVLAEIAATGVKLQVGFNRRFDATCEAAAERIAKGELGEAYLLRISQRDMIPPNPAFLEGSGGIFVDMGIHDFDMARWLVGEVTTVTAQGTVLSDPGFHEIGDFDAAVVVLGFANGALGTIDISRVAGYGYESSIEVMGSRGTVRIDAPFAHSYEWRSPGMATRPLISSYDQRYLPAFAAELESFARSLLDDADVRVTGGDALAAFDIAVAARESCRLNKTVDLAQAAPTRVAATSTVASQASEALEGRR